LELNLDVGDFWCSIYNSKAAAAAIKCDDDETAFK
jgi:hypothetical protein